VLFKANQQVNGPSVAMLLPEICLNNPAELFVLLEEGK
jgi:hypothetical protein